MHAVIEAETVITGALLINKCKKKGHCQFGFQSLPTGLFHKFNHQAKENKQTS